MMDKLLIITTGGTIDKVYFDDLSDFTVGEPVIAELLRVFNVDFEYELLPLFRKDSLEITESDRELIAEAVQNHNQSHVLITHGTDSMVKTARRLAAIENKKIVLTGALNPARFHGTDAVFNIGCALGALQTVESGVWLAMNGRIWHPDQVEKNRQENRFTARPESK